VRVTPDAAFTNTLNKDFAKGTLFIKLRCLFIVDHVNQKHPVLLRMIVRRFVKSEYHSRGQCYRTSHGRNLQIFVLS